MKPPPWHPGHVFIVQHEDAQVDVGSLVTHAVIGYDATADHYISRFENHTHFRIYMATAEGQGGR